MNHEAKLGFFARVWLALILAWRVIVDVAFADRARQLKSGAPAPKPELTEADTTSALQLLAIMQREGRFIDFLQEDVAGYSDAEVGVAARVVHAGCRRGLDEYLVLAPIRAEREGDAVVLESGFDPKGTRITGEVAGKPPFRGVLAHHGWRVAALRLPMLTDGHDASVIAPAEVELRPQ